MSGLNAMPLDTLREHVLGVILGAQQKGDAELLHLSVSIMEYLKDAQRWAWIKENCGGLPEFENPASVQEHVDFMIGLKK